MSEPIHGQATNKYNAMHINIFPQCPSLPLSLLFRPFSFLDHREDPFPVRHKSNRWMARMDGSFCGRSHCSFSSLPNRTIMVRPSFFAASFPWPNLRNAEMLHKRHVRAVIYLESNVKYKPKYCLSVSLGFSKL